MGASVHWKKALKEFTGETEMDPSALLEYFEPLNKWLHAENQRLKVPLGWGDTDSKRLLRKYLLLCVYVFFLFAEVAGDCCSAFST